MYVQDVTFQSETWPRNLSTNKAHFLSLNYKIFSIVFAFAKTWLCQDRSVLSSYITVPVNYGGSNGVCEIEMFLVEQTVLAN